MDLLLTRKRCDGTATEGELRGPDGALLCYTLELPIGDGGHGFAIADGHYQIFLAPSPKFEGSSDEWVRKYADAMPHLAKVLGRQFIMIHWGNKAVDTDGCILVGQSLGDDFIGSSRKAFESLYEMLRPLVRSGNLYIQVTTDPQATPRQANGVGEAAGA